MSLRVFPRKKPNPVHYFPISIGFGVLGGLVFVLIIKGFLFLENRDIYGVFPWGISFACSIAFFVVFMIGFAVRLMLSKARIELEGDKLSEFDVSSKLIARGSIEHVLAIEKVRLIKNDAYIVRFLNRNFIMIGEGFENSKELVDLVLSRSKVPVTDVGKISFKEFGENLKNRAPVG